MSHPSPPISRVLLLLVVLFPIMMITLVVFWLVTSSQDRTELDHARIASAQAADTAAHDRAARESAVAEARHSRTVEAQALSVAEDERKQRQRAQTELAAVRAGDPAGVEVADLRKQLQARDTELSLRDAEIERLTRVKDNPSVKDRPEDAKNLSNAVTQLTKQVETLQEENRRLAVGRIPADVNVKVRAQAWPAHPGALRSLALSPDGHRLATTSGNVTRVWDAANGTVLQEWIRKDSSVRQVAFTLDGKGVALLVGDGIQIVEADSGRETRALHWKGGTDGALSFQPSKARLLFGGMDSSLRLFDLATGSQILDLHENAPVRAVAFSADGRMLAYGKSDGNIGSKELDVSGSEHVFRAEPGGVLALAFSPDGALMASAGPNGVVHIWSTTTYKLVQTLHGHNGVVNSLTFSRDGGLLAAGGGNQANVWDAASGKELLAVGSRADGVAGIAFDETGKRLFVAQGNGVRVCDIEPATK